MKTTAQKFGPRFAIASYTVKVRGESGCSIMSTPALAEEQAKCYLASRPEGIVDVEYSEHCGHCRGAGRLLKSRRTLSWKTCPNCGGQPELHVEEMIKTYVGGSLSDWAI